MARPIKIGSKKFLKLQQTWYNKVERSGHVDVERFMDMNKYPLSTMPRGHGSFIFDREPDGEYDDDYDSRNGVDYTPIQDTDKAAFWRVVGHKAALVPVKDKRYKLLNAFADLGTFSAAAKEVGMERIKAQNIIRDWLKQIGLKDATGLSRSSKKEKPVPAPVKALSKSEIARLGYIPPKLIPDKPEPGKR
jgi:hypothetical protein